MNLAITCLFTSIPNPLCPGCDNYKPDPELLRGWVSSITGAHPVVLHDGWIGRDEYALLREWSPINKVTSRTVEVTDENLFFQRWRHVRSYITHHLGATDFAWVTDGSDVRMLNEPWEHMDPHTLYVGSEDDVVSNRWIVDNHPSIRQLAKRTPRRPLMNAGLLGGIRLMALTFIDLLIARFETCEGDLTDMAAFNHVLADDWGYAAMTGPPVHTRFGDWAKADRECWWAHK
jgi:hypothetical protein